MPVILFKVVWSTEAETTYNLLNSNPSEEERHKAVKKTIKLLSNPRHPSLQTHPYSSLTGPNGEKVFEAYAQQNTPAAYRVFWYYGPGKRVITVFAITPHP